MIKDQGLDLDKIYLIEFYCEGILRKGFIFKATFISHIKVNVYLCVEQVKVLSWTLMFTLG